MGDGEKQETEELPPFGTDYEEGRLCRAVCMRDLKKVKSLLECGVPTNSVTEDDESALHLAVKYAGKRGYAREFQKHAAFVNALFGRTSTSLNTVLSNEKDAEIVSQLLHHGARVNAVDCNGDTPLIIGVRNGVDVEIVRLLLKNGADPNIANNEQGTAIHYALHFKEDVDVVAELLAHGADFCEPNVANVIPLAIAMRRLLSVKCLVKHSLIHTFVSEFSLLFNLGKYSYMENYDVVVRYMEECVLELANMKAMELNNHSSLYAFVTTKNSNALLYLEGESTQIVSQEEKLKANYPIYSDCILPKVNHAVERGMLLRKLNSVFVYSRNHCDMIESFGEKVVLNNDCTLVIAKFLSNDNLCNFMLAFDNFESNVPNTGLENGKLRKRLLEAPTSNCIKKTRLK